MRRLQQALRRDLSAHLAALSEAMRTGDAKAAGRAAHGLKG